MAKNFDVGECKEVVRMKIEAWITEVHLREYAISSVIAVHHFLHFKKIFYSYLYYRITNGI